MVRAAPPPAAMEELEGQLGYAFRDRVWLLQALTHRSLRSREEAVAQDNERLEFLGDAILGFVVSDALCALFPHLSEGKLSRIKANLVNRRRLGQVAKRLELGRYLRLGLGEEKTGGRHKQAILANAVEALVAALYRDGGLAAARRFLEVFLLQELRESSLEPFARADYKSAFQEYLQSRRLPAARYHLVESRGPEHRKSFTVELWVGEQCLARGEGASKKAAEQQAARQALAQLPVEVETEST
ncbi:MAG TPA: ribonuclease III [Candidatus Acidoferrales bacterium]|nr:ribonuclease III [Candidatus Acidoferrales bacterium]